MKIILINEEAHQYMDMRDDIYTLNKHIAELEHTIAQYEAMITPEENKHTEAYNTAMEVILPTDAYPYNTTKKERTYARWNDSDKTELSLRIFITDEYYGYARTIETIHSLFPNRTRAAVTAMIYALGGTVKKGIVHPRIQPKQKENNA
jgi:hypothetical protein